MINNKFYLYELYLLINDPNFALINLGIDQQSIIQWKIRNHNLFSFHYNFKISQNDKKKHINLNIILMLIYE